MSNSSQYHKIKLQGGCCIFITTTELIQALTMNEEVWTRVIERGKAFRRAQDRRKREGAIYEKEYKDKPLNDRQNDLISL